MEIMTNFSRWGQTNATVSEVVVSDDVNFGDGMEWFLSFSMICVPIILGLLCYGCFYLRRYDVDGGGDTTHNDGGARRVASIPGLRLRRVQRVPSPGANGGRIVLTRVLKARQHWGHRLGGELQVMDMQLARPLICFCAEF